MDKKVIKIRSVSEGIKRAYGFIQGGVCRIMINKGLRKRGAASFPAAGAIKQVIRHFLKLFGESI